MIENLVETLYLDSINTFLRRANSSITYTHFKSPLSSKNDGTMIRLDRLFLRHKLALFNLKKRVKLQKLPGLPNTDSGFMKVASPSVRACLSALSLLSMTACDGAIQDSFCCHRSVPGLYVVNVSADLTLMDDRALYTT